MLMWGRFRSGRRVNQSAMAAIEPMSTKASFKSYKSRKKVIVDHVIIFTLNKTLSKKNQWQQTCFFKCRITVGSIFILLSAGCFFLFASLSLSAASFILVNMALMMSSASEMKVPPSLLLLPLLQTIKNILKQVEFANAVNTTRELLGLIDKPFLLFLLQH